MQLLLCAATPFEIPHYINTGSGTGHFPFRTLITGVGLTAATYTLTKEVFSSRPDFILQAGVAGSLDRSLPPGSVVVVRNEMIGDLGVMEGSGFRSLFDLKLAEENKKPWTRGKLQNSSQAVSSSTLTIVDSVTVNEISTDPVRIEHYRQLGAQIESMEGAALHYVALQENIPFLQLRALSNYVGERDKSQWKMEMAIERLHHHLSQLINKMISL